MKTIAYLPTGTEARFLAKVHKDPETGCWLWTACKRKGYGAFWLDGHTLRAHRWAYEHFVGPIPGELQLDHLCRVCHCVNPAHLEAVTPQVNTLRSSAVTALNATRTACPVGHPYSVENTYQSRGRRYCKTCVRAYRSAWKAMSPEDRASRKARGLPVVPPSSLPGRHLAATTHTPQGRPLRRI